MSAPESQARAALDYAIAASQRTSIPLHEVVSSLERLTHMIRLQARWDARDEVLRGLIKKWGGESAALWRHMPDDEYARGKNRAADELERAIGGGK